MRKKFSSWEFSFFVATGIAPHKDPKTSLARARGERYAIRTGELNAAGWPALLGPSE